MNASVAVAALIGSMLTGATSVPTGQDSVETAGGVCPPIPGEFIADGASMPTGKLETVLTASSAPLCGPVPPDWEMIYWFEADRLVTMDSSNRVTRWGDLTPNQFDVEPVDQFGSPTPVGQWPVWTPNVHPSGLASMDWGSDAFPAQGRYLQNLQGASDPLPCAAGAARTTIALLKLGPTGIGGRVVTFRRTTNVIVLSFSINIHLGGLLGKPIYATDATFRTRCVPGGISTPPPDGTNAAPTTITDYANQSVVVAWVLHAAGAMDVYVNGTLIPTFAYTFDFGSQSPLSLLQPDDGHGGFTLGPSATDGYKMALDGFMGINMCYAGDDLARLAIANAYVMARGGVT